MTYTDQLWTHTLPRLGALETHSEMEMCLYRFLGVILAPVRKCSLQAWANRKVELRCNYYRSSATPSDSYRAGTTFQSCPKSYSQIDQSPDTGGPWEVGCNPGQSHSFQSNAMPRKGLGCEPSTASTLGSWGMGRNECEPEGDRPTTYIPRHHHSIKNRSLKDLVRSHGQKHIMIIG